MFVAGTIGAAPEFSIYGIGGGRFAKTPSKPLSIMISRKFQEKLLLLQPNMLNFAFILTSNRDDAYDLLQDTTLKALDNEEKFKENTNFKGWVFTIMRNIFINNYRRAARTSVKIDTTDELYHLNLSQSSNSVSPENTCSVNELNEAIASFAPDYRVPFSMHLAGYHYAEIAQHMHLPVGTVKSRIYNARQRLRRMLKDY